MMTTLTIDSNMRQPTTDDATAPPVPVITNQGIVSFDGGIPSTPTSFEPPASMLNPEHFLHSLMRLGVGIVGVVFSVFIVCAILVDREMSSGLIATVVSILVTIGAVAIDLKDGRNSTEEKRIENAKRRLVALLDETSSRRPGIAYALHLLKEHGAPDGQGIPLLVRFDPVLRRYEDLDRKVGHDADVVARARSAAVDAVERISLDHKASNGSDEQALLASFEKEILAIGDGRDPTTPTRMLIPSARISRIIGTAEKALSAHPDMTDANGGRIDALVRTHVPRLLETHAVAAGTATSQEMEEVDAALDQAIELVRASVEEGVGRIHDDAMSALATELRFLSLRKGDAPLLVAAC
jgi:hypothetical protein